MRIDKEIAKIILRDEASQHGRADNLWVKRLEDFSNLCEHAPKTHIAFLGTAILAKAVDLNVDVFSVKAKAPRPGAYSARSLCDNVLVPLSTELGINLGVTGREPLNNQPYFRMIWIGDGTPVHANSKQVFSLLQNILGVLANITAPQEARSALRAFIQVRRQRQPNYAEYVTCNTPLPLDDFISLVMDYVAENSEGGKRAQAVVAGLLDCYAGNNAVRSGRINDPDRRFPGDVIVLNSEQDQVEKTFEVRDKPVSQADVLLFGKKALEAGIREAAVVAIAPNQGPMDMRSIASWSAQQLMGLTVFLGWPNFIKQTLFWSALTEPYAISQAFENIHNRLVLAEVSEAGVALWSQAISVRGKTD